MKIKWNERKPIRAGGSNKSKRTKCEEHADGECKGVTEGEKCKLNQ